MHYFLFICSKEYLYKGLVLYRTIQKHDSNFHCFFICLDNESQKLLSKFAISQATILCMAQIERWDRELLKVKRHRSTKEYIWTAKASALLYVLNRYKEVDYILWLDGDAAFLSSPRCIFDEWREQSILLTEEGYTGPHEYLSYMYGKYNTGLMGFKRSKTAFECLKWFRARLLEWCYDKHEDGRWSDQKYVCDWMDRFEKVGIIKNAGVNMTPFILRRRMDEEASEPIKRDGEVYLGDIRIVFFHYYGFKYISKGEFDLCSYNNWNFSERVLEHIYLPYIEMCNAAIEEINGIKENFGLPKVSWEHLGYQYILPSKDESQTTGSCAALEDEDLDN